MLYGILAGQTVVLTGEGEGRPVVDSPEPSPIDGYEARGKWVDAGDSIARVYEYVPAEGTAQEAAVRLSRLQAQSLPDDAAVLFVALYPEWVPGMQCYGPDSPTGNPQTRLNRKGTLYKALSDHVATKEWPPESAPSLYARVLPGQSGEVGEWVQPDSTNGYAKGDRVTHAGKLWESTADGNVWEPGATGAPWKEVED